MSNQEDLSPIKSSHVSHKIPERTYVNKGPSRFTRTHASSDFQPRAQERTPSANIHVQRTSTSVINKPMPVQSHSSANDLIITDENPSSSSSKLSFADLLPIYS